MLTAFACNSPVGCAGFQAQAPGTYVGPKIDSAGALRVSAHGFQTINQNSTALLALLAPGGNLDTSVDCEVKSAGVLGSFTVGDQGSVGCASETCGRGDGVCNPLVDVPQKVAIGVTGLVIGSASPDLIEAKLTATVQTGLIVISSVDRTHALCLFAGNGPVKCSLDFDSARKTPTTTELTVEIKLALRNGLLSVEVADLAGTKACGTAGASSLPACIDPGDIVIAAEPGGCNVCSTLNAAIVKQLLIDELAKSLKKNLASSLAKSTCQACGPSRGVCPTNAACVVDMADAGRCIETVGGLCSPRFLGLEGRADLSSLGVPGAGIDLSLALGGATAASPSGATIGMRGGIQEILIAPCVKPLSPVTWPNLPLPNFELGAPAGYDVSFTLSHQLLSEAFFHAQQSGALCLELGAESVTQLGSGTLEPFLPSLKLLTGGANVPLRMVLRPVNPPTATIGAGTLDAQGKPLEPLIRLTWPGVEIDVYAKIEERFMRLFTVAADLELPIGLDVVSCGSVKPVIGSLMNAVKKVEVKNSELLSEDLAVIGQLVPTLLTLAEPTLAKGLPGIDLPTLGAELPMRVKLLQARGVDQVTGSSTYNHVGVYAALVPIDGGCP